MPKSATVAESEPSTTDTGVDPSPITALDYAASRSANPTRMEAEAGTSAVANASTTPTPNRAPSLHALTPADSDRSEREYRSEAKVRARVWLSVREEQAQPTIGSGVVVGIC